jgi:hypothetical protein
VRTLARNGLLGDYSGDVDSRSRTLARTHRQTESGRDRRNRDRIFGDEFRKDVQAMGIEEVLSAPRSPWQRAYVERVIGTIRRECLDHVIVFK